MDIPFRDRRRTAEAEAAAAEPTSAEPVAQPEVPPAPQTDVPPTPQPEVASALLTAPDLNPYAGTGADTAGSAATQPHAVAPAVQAQIQAGTMPIAKSQWAGKDNWTCTLCGYASLSEAQVNEHLVSMHSHLFDPNSSPLVNAMRNANPGLAQLAPRPAPKE